MGDEYTKKQLVLITIILLLLTISLNGCEEKKNNSPFSMFKTTDNVELIDYSVVTMWETGSIFDDTYKKHCESGFYHGIPENVGEYDIEYKINGTVKNNADKLLNSISIKMIFFDVDDNELFTETTSTGSLPHSYTDSFSVVICKFMEEYFDNVNYISFSLIGSYIEY